MGSVCEVTVFHAGEHHGSGCLPSLRVELSGQQFCMTVCVYDRVTVPYDCMSFNSYLKSLDFSHLTLRENSSTSRFRVLQKLQT